MIEFVHAGKTYPNGVRGLKDVSLTIEQGEFVAIIGLSGAGKSTLIRTINRMIDVTEGQVTVDGVDVMTLRGKALRRFRRHIGMIFQSFNLVTRSTVIKNVLTSMVPDMGFFRVLLGIFTKKQEMAALAALDKVGILDKAYTRCDQLSGGQQQRVALARTLNQNPSIILADEPVAALDPVTANQVMSDFRRINKDMNITILINIHHVDLALDYAERVIGIRAGEIVYDGPVKQVTQAVLDAIYNGAPAPKAADGTNAPADPVAAARAKGRRTKGGGGLMARTRAPRAVKPPLFDRIFKPRVMTVDGHSVMKPRSRAPLIALVLVAAVWGSLEVTGFDIGIILRRGHQLTVILEKIFHPDWSYFHKVVPPLLDTIKMSVMGSAIGSALSLPFAVMASANINKSGASVAVLRVLLNIVRTLPTLVIASICALIFSLGTFAGTVAITVFTFGIVAKMLYESIETIDMGAFEAMEALGASKFQAFWSACFPQILPTYLSHCLYSFEINIRAASILGYVGAGGLGILINERIGWRDYEGLGTVLIALFVVVLIIENVSQALRRRLS